MGRGEDVSVAMRRADRNELFHGPTDAQSVEGLSHFSGAELARCNNELQDVALMWLLGRARKQMLVAS